MKLIETETPGFLNALKDVVKMLTPKEEETPEALTSESEQFLHEKLREIKSACEEWDKTKAREFLALLKEKSWPKQTKELLDKINEQLLHSDFDEIGNEIDEFLTDK
jgi:hypothetical protein